MKRTHDKSYFDKITIDGGGRLDDKRLGESRFGKVLQVGEVAGQAVMEFLPLEHVKEDRKVEKSQERNGYLEGQLSIVSKQLEELKEKNKELEESLTAARSRNIQKEKEFERTIMEREAELKSLSRKLAEEKTMRLNAQTERNAELQKKRQQEMIVMGD